MWTGEACGISLGNYQAVSVTNYDEYASRVLMDSRLGKLYDGRKFW